MTFKKLWEEPKNVSTKYFILNNVFSAITHCIGFGLAIAGLVILIIRSASTGNAIRVVSFTIFGTSLVILYLFSTLYHSLVFTKAKRIFQIFDHSSIFILIAGSYTPYALVMIGGFKGWLLFGIIYTLAIIGILFCIFNKGKRPLGEIILYIVMGWTALTFGNTIFPLLGKSGFLLLLSGGLAYTIGALLYTMKRIPYIHVIWHLFVILGSALIYFSILLYV